jgi:hypothetical protein
MADDNSMTSDLILVTVSVFVTVNISVTFFVSVAVFVLIETAWNAESSFMIFPEYKNS